MAHLTGKIIHQRYCVVDILGEGGTGITYRALDQHTNQQVAIKTLSLRQVKDWKVVELFEREAKVLQQLQHPHIPKYLDYFVSDNDRSDLASTQLEQNFYIVQELAEGQSLFRWLQEDGRCTEAEVKAIAVQVLKILDYLHGLNSPVIHRDIKPHNLIRREDGHIFLVDFGAVQNTYHSTFMRGSTVVGTFGYMAPEQFRGQAAPATDFYGLGATLLFLLTQRSPAELPTQKLKVEFRSRIKLSDSFADWLEKMLEPAAKDRFESAQEALTAINRQSNGFSTITNQLRIACVTGIIGLLLYLCFLLMEGKKYFLLNRLNLTASAYSSIREGEIKIDEYLTKGGDVNAKGGMGRTLIYDVIASRSIPTIKYLLSKGAKLNVVDDYGRTPLHAAVEQSLSDIQGGKFQNTEEDRKTIATLDYILSLNEINILTKDQQDKTAIEYVNSPEMARVFIPYIKQAKLSKGIKVSLLNQLIDHSLEKNWLEFAAYLKNEVAQGSTIPLEKIALKAYTAEDSAILKGLIHQRKKLNVDFFKGTDFYQLRRILLDNEILSLMPHINVVDRQGSTLLNHLAAAMSTKKDFEMVQKLIQLKADVNLASASGQIPFSNCLSSSTDKEAKDEIALALLDAGTNIGKMPTVLHETIRKSSFRVVQELLNRGANPNALENSNNTPLHTAVDRSEVGVVQILLKARANVNAKDRYGKIPLHYVSNSRIVELLIKAGASVNEQDRYGLTPLHTITNQGSLDAIDALKALLQAGGNPNAKNRAGQIPLHALAEGQVKSSQMAQLLIDAGADVNMQENSGFTPLDRLIEQSSLSHRNIMAVEKQIKTLYFIFTQHGAKTNNYRQDAKVFR
jgi:ankyrin repeat protein